MRRLAECDSHAVLLSGGADINFVNHHGETPLSSAAFEGHLEVCLLLLAGGANVDHLADGITALWLAATRGHLDVCAALLATGADVRLAPPSTLPALLYVGAQQVHVAVCEL